MADPALARAVAPDTNKQLALYRQMLYLRLAEHALAREYKKQEMRTPCHFGVGQEAIAVGVCAALRPDDAVYSHHRCHNHYLARGGSLEKLAAELYGRETGCSHGRGGSVHLTARDVGFVVSSAILGQTIAVAAGSALAFKMDKSDRVAVSFFGEGAGDEGVTWETFNYASLRNLPVLFVCENNGYATETKQPSTTDLCARAKAFGLITEHLDGNDVMAVHEAAQWWIERCRKGCGPVFLECETYRHLEHVGPNLDHESGRTYRSQAELKEWKKRDPFWHFDGTTEAMRKIQAQVVCDVQIAIARASRAPAPTELMANV